MRSSKSRPQQFLSGEWLFAAFIAAYGIIYLSVYPASYSISDESRTIALAQAIRRGTVFLDSPLWGLPIGGRIVSKFSPIHAALLIPALATFGPAMFLVSAAFFVAGAFTLRSMLRRAGIGSEWCFLYFMLAGALYYSQTVMAAVPAAVLGLLGISLCLRDRPRPVLAGLALGAAVLVHPWMAPIAVVFAIAWSLEQGGLRILRAAAALVAGAAPAIAALMAYNRMTAGGAFRDAYTVLGRQYDFDGAHFASFFPFYVFSFAAFPLCGWCAFSRRWSGTWSIPALCAVTITMESLYYYRDGLNVGSARVQWAALIYGFIPGQRLLIPASMIACLPAARFLSAHAADLSHGVIRAGRIAALCIFAVSFLAMSLAHQSYLSAHTKVQQALVASFPRDAKIAVDDDTSKEFAPVSFAFTGLYEIEDSESVPPDRFYAALVTPGGVAPETWSRGHKVIRIPVRSWAWNRDLLIGSPTPSR
jgi:hypothetical protein